MPKIIDDINMRILQEAKKQLLENGFTKMTIRSVAGKCQIAPGTIYNYYSSKEELVAAFMLEDWKELEQKLIKTCACAKGELKKCGILYEGLMEFDEKYRKMYAESTAIQSASTFYPVMHQKLRTQLADILVGASDRKRVFRDEFLAESMIAWSCENRSFSELEPLLKAITDMKEQE